MELHEAVQHEVERLAEEFAGTFSRETIDQYVHDSLSTFRHARVLDFVPLLTYRFARERLRESARPPC